MSPGVIAGGVAGGVALLVFVLVHAMWIVPIWGMLAMLPLAALVGALAAWPFDEMGRGALPPAPFDGVAIALLLLASLVPTAIYGVLVGPLDQQHITWQAVIVPLALAAPAGAVIGLVLTGSAPLAGALALAATAFALTLGHNLPFFPIGSPGAGKAIVLVVVPTLAAAVAFSAARTIASLPSAGAAPR